MRKKTKRKYSWNATKKILQQLLGFDFKFINDI